MNQQTETTTPLYKVLNEKRTQGEISIDRTSFFYLLRIGKISFAQMSHIEDRASLLDDNYDEKIQLAKKTEEANAQYTALAVNNLAKMAEIITRMISYYDGDISDSNPFSKQLMAEAKETLARIS